MVCLVCQIGSKFTRPARLDLEYDFGIATDSWVQVSVRDKMGAYPGQIWKIRIQLQPLFYSTNVFFKHN